MPQTIGTTSATTLEFQLLMLVLRPQLANTRTFALFSGSKWRTVANIYVRVVQVHTYAVHEGRYHAVNILRFITYSWKHFCSYVHMYALLL